MNDRIELRGIALKCLVGVHDWERTAPRDVVVDLLLELDLEPAADKDDLALTVDYDALVASLRRHAESASPRLLETLASQIAEICLAEERVDGATVTVRKPGAVAGVADVSVTVRRDRL